MWITIVIMELNEIKGIGKKRIEGLNKAGINDPIDLLYFFPYAYLSKDKINCFTIDPEEYVLVQGKISELKNNFISRSLIITSAFMSLPNGQKIRLKWFNQKFIKNTFIADEVYCLYGKIKISKNENYILNPKKIVFERDIMPLYKNISGVSGSLISYAINCVLRNCEIAGVLPKEIENKYGLENLKDIFLAIHNPMEINSAESACRVLALYRLILKICAFNLSRPNENDKRVIGYNSDLSKLEQAIQALPYRLTFQQDEALKKIVSSLNSDKMLNMLLQGDVGSGKTIVAMLAMYYAFLSGYQSVLLVPTELLCEQHFASALFFEKFGVKVCIFTGSQSKQLKQELIFDIKHGTVDFIIATHAILNEDIDFRNLGLIITDEQQRFGVAQRAFLKNKANADYITLTATPIPRTLAMVMYGELQQVIIAQRPNLRQKIKTVFVKSAKLESMYNYFYDKAERNEQTYIVCPRIEDDEELTSCIVLYSKLKKTKLGKYLGLLHGKLDEREKVAIMQKFARGEIKILMTTTIIEVGIDVSTATSIAIFDPERYGLSQLHQLRGRVGRGTIESYCFLVTDDKKERLRMFADNDDGFALAEYDLETRGAGDFIGLRQHGKSESFYNIRIDVDMIKQARNISQEVINSGRFIGQINNDYTKYLKEIILN